MVLGLLTSVICGGGSAAQAVFLAKSIAALSLPLSEHAEIRRQAGFWSPKYLMLVFAQFLALIAYGIALNFGAGRLTRRIRDQGFRHILRQDIAYFDKNSSGALTSFLSTEATHLAGLSGIPLMVVLSLLTTQIAASDIGLVAAWKLSLVRICTISLLLACGYIRSAMLVTFQAEKKKVHESSASYACEAISAVWAVASLTREGEVVNHYQKQLREISRHLIV